MPEQWIDVHDLRNGQNKQRQNWHLQDVPSGKKASAVVEAVEELRLLLASGETVTTRLVGRDPSTGIALFKSATAAVAPVLEKAGPVRYGHLSLSET